MLVRYNHFGYYNSEKRSRERIQAQGEIWPKAVRATDIWTSPDIR